MVGLVPAIHAAPLRMIFGWGSLPGVDTRHKAGHDIRSVSHGLPRLAEEGVIPNLPR